MELTDELIERAAFALHENRCDGEHRHHRPDESNARAVLEAVADDIARQAVADALTPILSTLNDYFDFDVDPWDDYDAACPETADLWRLHRDLRAAIKQAEGPRPQPQPHTKEENLAFRKDWDARVDEARERNQP